MQKKYSFDKILKEYNEKYNYNYMLPSEAFNVTIIHTIESRKFHVIYTNEIGTKKEKTPLNDFIHYRISRSITWRHIREIILSKEEKKLDLKIEIWPPNKVRYAYLYSNYSAKDVGNLGKSCMRSKDMQKALNFYVKNKIRIVVVIDTANKIHARAMLWDNVKSTKLKIPFTYLDRVYTDSDTLCLLFYDLADENKWKRYPSTTVNQMNNYYYKEGVILAGMCHLPFMDTFRYLYSKDNLLAASTELNKSSNPYTTLNEHTNCGYYPNLDPNRTREAFTGSYISKKDAVFIIRYKDNYDGYVLKKNITSINGTYYSIADDKIVKTKLDGYILEESSVEEVITTEIISKTTAVFSDKYKGYIHKSNAVTIKGEMYHRKDIDIICFSGKWYHISQCFINYNREKRNTALSKKKFHFWIEDEVFVPHPDDFVTRKGDLIPKECAIIAYDLTYSPVLDTIEFQEVYRIGMAGLYQLTTGEWIVSSPKNRGYIKKFNNKWYIKKDFKLPDKKQLMFSFMTLGKEK